MKTAIVINAGGNGTRLWPVSREIFPKQFAKLISNKSLIRNTFERVARQYNINDIYISTNQNFRDLTINELPELDPENIFVEPKRMDTAPAIGLATFKLKGLGYDTVINIASDHNIANVEEFLRVLKIAEEVNSKYSDHLLLIGMNPNFASTGYGYIEMGEPVDRFSREIVFSVSSFKEKPYKELAERFVSDWRYLWNAGYFIYNPDFLLSKYKEFIPNTYDALKECIKYDPNSEEFLKYYSKCDLIAFDYAINEKLKEILVMPASVGWSDIGSWKSIRDIISGNDAEKNICLGNVIDLDSEGVIAYSKDKSKTITILGLKDIIIVDNGDALLVANINRSEDIKKLLEKVPDNLK